jgi:hypothetical protein
MVLIITSSPFKREASRRNERYQKAEGQVHETEIGTKNE